ncbi:MAG: hypothetical protein FJY85_20130, partial [Deltaproteobacteria bacterium]|nr:hypothetical protein [Deltaproteobacteria bacterium]
AEKTGYPADMLDTGLDLEADLGIDTVKQAEFISEVREIFDIPRIEGLKIADFPTISHIIGFVQDMTRKSAAKAEEPVADKPVHKAPAVHDEVRLFEARLVDLPRLDVADAVEVDEVLIAGGPEDLALEVERALRSWGCHDITRIAAPSLPDGSATRRVGIVNLFPMSLDPATVRQTFQLYLSAASALEKGPAFLVAAVCEDGAYGFEYPTQDGYLAGEVAGATKSFSREYPDTRVRMLDLHPELSASDSATAIVRSLQETFPLETAVGKDGLLKVVRLVPHLSELLDVGLNPGDVVLVSGGGGGITAACIRYLAEKQSSLTFVILDLTTLSSRAEQLACFQEQEWDQEKARIIERLKREGKTTTPVVVNREIGRLQAEASAFRTVQAIRSLGSEVTYRSMDIR